MKTNINAIIVFSVIILAIIGAYIGFSYLSVIDETPESNIDYSNQVAIFGGECSVASDCNDYFKGLGATDEMLSDMDIVCVENTCGVRG